MREYRANKKAEVEALKAEINRLRGKPPHRKEGNV